MRHHFFDIAFTDTVKAEQARRGSRAAYAAAAAEMHDASADTLSPPEAEFIMARDSFYLASVSETGWPYVQHRGGPAGFVRQIDATTIGWAEYAGNRQYVSVGNAAVNDRVALFFMDYPHRQRLKVLGHMHVVEASERPDLARLLAVDGYKARVDRFVVVAIEAFDWNCPQHITPRFTIPEIEAAVEPLHARIAELEARLQARDAVREPPLPHRGEADTVPAGDG